MHATVLHRGGKSSVGGIDIPAVLLRPFPPKAGPLLHLALPLPVCTTHAA